MAKEEKKEEDKTKGKGPVKINFTCRCCERQKPIEEMRVITRFFPVLVVCQNCEKEMC